MDYTQLITVNPVRRAGKPCIRNTRTAVQDVLDYLASGMTEEDILEEYPTLTLEDIHACLAFAAAARQ